MVSDNETKYKIDNLDSFDTSNDLFGDSTPLMNMESDAYIILPNTASFQDAVSTLEYADTNESSDLIATIAYTYSNVPVGSCNIYFSKEQKESFHFAADSNQNTTDTAMNTDTNATSKVIFINIKKVLLGVLAVAGIIIFILILISFINSYSFSPRGQSSKRRRQRSKEARAAKRNARRNARLFKKQQKKRRKAYKKRH